MKHLRSLLLGFVLGGVAMYGVFVLSTPRPPATPELRPPTAIKVTLHPWDGIRGTDCEPVDIPPEKLDLAFRLLTPEKFFEIGVQEFITPIVAQAVITHGRPSNHAKRQAIDVMNARKQAKRGQWKPWFIRSHRSIRTRMSCSWCATPRARWRMNG